MKYSNLRYIYEILETCPKNKTIVDNNITMLQMYIDKKSLEDIFIEATTDVDEPIDYEEDFQDEEVQENITDDTEKEIEENPDDNEDKEDE